MTAKKVSIWDLTGAQAAELELEFGIRFSDWWERAPSQIALLMAIHAAAHATDKSTLGDRSVAAALSMRELLAVVSIAGDNQDAEDAETENPT